MGEKKENNLKTIIFSFIWSYKKGDNILYNFSILNELYKSKRKSDKKLLYNKPLILIIAAIIECILEDFITRIKQHVHEKISNLSEAVIKDFKYINKGECIEIRKLDKFNHFISHAKKHKIFGSLTENYETMELIRKLRNRLHIQNSEDDLEKDEYKIFNETNLHLAEKLLELILIKMTNNYPRAGAESEINFEELNFPWK